jgi:hypothetical protein
LHPCISGNAQNATRWKDEEAKSVKHVDGNSLCYPSNIRRKRNLERKKNIKKLKNRTENSLAERPDFLNVDAGFSVEELQDVSEDSATWSGIVKSYWSLLSPLIFSDHPKRPGEEDPLPPSNIVRNVMDMNALHGSLNVALLKAKKSVWVMNVVPRSTQSLIFTRGLIGIQHDWYVYFAA